MARWDARGPCFGERFRGLSLNINCGAPPHRRMFLRSPPFSFSPIHFALPSWQYVQPSSLALLSVPVAHVVGRGSLLLRRASLGTCKRELLLSNFFWRNCRPRQRSHWHECRRWVAALSLVAGHQCHCRSPNAGPRSGPRLAHVVWGPRVGGAVWRPSFRGLKRVPCFGPCAMCSQPFRKRQVSLRRLLSVEAPHTGGGEGGTMGSEARAGPGPSQQLIA